MVPTMLTGSSSARPGSVPAGDEASTRSGHEGSGEPADAAHEVAHEVALDATGLAGLRILVVDDEVDARELFAMVLRGTGAEVGVAGSVDEALTAFVEERPESSCRTSGCPPRTATASSAGCAC